MNELSLNTIEFETLYAFMPVSRGGVGIFGLLITLLLILVVVTLLMRMGRSVCRQRRAPKIFILLGIIAVGAFVMNMREREHRRIWSQILPQPTNSQSYVDLVEDEKLILTLRRGEKLPQTITGVDLALALKQFAHNVALATQDNSDLDQLRWKELTVLRNDDGTVELGDVVMLRRITRRHQGPQNEDLIELRSDDPSTLDLFADTAIALEERIDAKSDPTLRLEVDLDVDEARLLIHIAHGEDMAIPEIAARDQIVLDAIEVETPKAEDESVAENITSSEPSAEEFKGEDPEANTVEDRHSDEVDGIISTAIRGLFEGLAEAKRERARHKSDDNETVKSAKPAVEESEEIEEAPASTENEVIEVAAVVATSPSGGAAAPAEFAAPGLNDQGEYQITIHAGPHSNLNDCEAELAEKRQAALADYAEKLLGSDAAEQINVEQFLFTHKVPERRKVEEFEHPEFGPMLNLYAELTFDREIQQALRSQYHDAVIGERLKLTGVASASVLLMLSAVFGFLKLDTASRGYYRGRLAVGVAGVAFLVVVLGFLAIGS